MSNRPRRALFGGMGIASALLICTATLAHASSNTLPIGAGSLSIGTLSNTTFASTPVGAGTVSGAVNSGNWSDTTGSGQGWHGTLQTSFFVDQGVFVQTGGTTTALGAAGASGAYTGTVGNALVTVTVTSGGTAVNTPFSWSDREGAGTTTGTVSVCPNLTACAVSNGVTITFATATTYPAGAVYAARVGALASGAMTVDTAAGAAVVAQGTTLGGANLPTYEGNTNPVTAGGGAVPVITAAVNAGMGTFAVAPGVTVTWDPANSWAGSGVNFVATAQYAISTGP